MGAEGLRRGRGFAARVIIAVAIAVVAAAGGLPFSPAALAAPIQVTAPIQPRGPVVNYAYTTLPGDGLRVTVDLAGTAGDEVSVGLPGPVKGLEVAPETTTWRLDGQPGSGPTVLELSLETGKATITADFRPMWASDGTWIWVPLAAVSPVPLGDFRLGGLTARGDSPVHVIGGPRPGEGFLARGPGGPLHRWRLNLAEGAIEVYAEGAEPPAGLSDVARLAIKYGLGGRNRLVLFSAGGDAGKRDVEGLVARFWEAALDWDLGPDQAGWLRGLSLFSLAAEAAGGGPPSAAAQRSNSGRFGPEDYLTRLARDLGGPALEEVRETARGEALTLALNQTLRERTDGRAGIAELLDYLSHYGAGLHLDPFGLRQAATATVGRNLDGFFDRAFGPPPPPDGLLDQATTLVADTNNDGSPDFIAREAEALRLAAGVTTSGTAESAAFSDAGEVAPGGAAAGDASPGKAGPGSGSDSDRHLVYLTFDDGPSAVTPRILETLRENGVKATFFVIGNRVHAYAETVRRMARDGNVIGNHTFDHVNANVYRSPEAFLASLERAGEAIRDVAGVFPTVVRAPGGSKAHFTREYYSLLAEKGYKVYDWDVSAADTDPSRPGPEVIAGNVLSGVKGRKTAIVLMHDGPGHETTAEALPAIIAELRDAGYEFATLDSR